VPDPLQALLAADLVPTAVLPPTSRYADIGSTAYTPRPAPGEEPVPVPHFRRRLCPPPERFALLYEYVAVEGDRRDLVAARHLGDAELWWRLADAGGVLDPERMTLPGCRVRITLPDSVPGGTDA